MGKAEGGGDKGLRGTHPVHPEGAVQAILAEAQMRDMTTGVGVGVTGGEDHQGDDGTDNTLRHQEQCTTCLLAGPAWKSGCQRNG